MYKKIVWIAALMLSLVFNPTAFAAMGCEGGMKKMVESLNLDNAQKDKIKPIMEQLKSDMHDKYAQMHDLKMQLEQQAMSEHMDQMVVSDLIDKKTKLIGEMMKAKIMAKNQIAAILNVQQKTMLQAKMKAVREKIEAQFKACRD